MDKLVLHDWVWSEEEMSVKRTSRFHKSDSDVVIDVVNTKFLKDPIETSISLSLTDAQRLRDYLTDILKETEFEAQACAKLVTTEETTPKGET